MTGLPKLLLVSTSLFATSLASAGLPTLASLDDSAPLELEETTNPSVLIAHHPRTPEAVWGGTEVGPSEFARVGALFALQESGNQWYGGNFCSATVIHDRWVLTAAHCVEAMASEYNGYDLYVSFDNEASDFTTYVQAKRWFTHPDYNGQQISNDVGLIELTADSPVGVQPVNSDNPNPWRGEKLTFVGYGVTQDNGWDSGIKRKTEITFQGCQEPTGWYSSCESDNRQILYSYSEGTNVCSGDSGGAVFYRDDQGVYRLAGVNSFVSGGCVGGGTGSARVDVFLPWIMEYIPDLLDADEAGTGDGAPGDGTLDTPPGTSPDDQLLDPPARPGDEQLTKGGCSSLPLAPTLGWLLPGLFTFVGTTKRRP